MHFSHHPAIGRNTRARRRRLFARGMRRGRRGEPAIAAIEAVARRGWTPPAPKRAARDPGLAPRLLSAWAEAHAVPLRLRVAAAALRKEGALPRIHPLIDLCNAISMAFAIPVAVLDVAASPGDLQVRHAEGSEKLPHLRRRGRAPGAGRGELRRCAGQRPRAPLDQPQSGLSAVRDATSDVLGRGRGHARRRADDVAR
jgi:hypothetical protein